MIEYQINQENLKKLKESCLELLKVFQKRWEKYKSDCNECKNCKQLSRVSNEYIQWIKENITSQGLYTEHDSETGKPIIIGTKFYL